MRKLVIALRRLNSPDYSEWIPIYQGDHIQKLWILIAPPAGQFSIYPDGDSDVAGPVNPKMQFTVFEGHPEVGLISKPAELRAKGYTCETGFAEKLLKMGLARSTIIRRM